MSVDVRSAQSLPDLLPVLTQLRLEGIQVRSVFLDASTDALVRRFPKPAALTPCSKAGHRSRARRAKKILVDTISLERELRSPLREVSTVIDTSLLRPAQLLHLDFTTWCRPCLHA